MAYAIATWPSNRPWQVMERALPRRFAVQLRDLDSSLQSFGEYLLKAQIVRANAAPYFVRWVRRFLARRASNEPLADQVRRFCEDLERHGGIQDWQIRQADQALRIYFVNFLE